MEDRFGIPRGALNLTRVNQRLDTWTLIVDLNNDEDNCTARYVDSFSSAAADDQPRETDLIELTTGEGIMYVSQASKWSNDQNNGRNHFLLEVLQPDYHVHEVGVRDDVTSWREGDKIVVASTDFDWEQVMNKPFLSLFFSLKIMIK